MRYLVSMTRTNRLRTRIFSLLALGLAGGMQPSHASTPGSCPIEMSKLAESSLVGARGSWPTLLEHRKAFAACDDGVLAEGYSDAVAHLLAQMWEQFPTFAALAKNQPEFQMWAIRHIDASASDEDLGRIIINATTCNDDVTVKALCNSIRQAARNAKGLD